MSATAPTTAHTRLEKLMLRAFYPGRPARSAAYMAGVRAKLRRALQGERLACPYPQGSTEFDAFFAGLDEGARIARGYRESLA